jgi:protocatechuate 3,4-dioxygenase beta subunit
LDACKKTSTTDGGSGITENCISTANEVERPYPYAGGEITNPLQRADVTAGQTGLPLTLNFSVINVNNNCAIVSDAGVDIWHCNKDGYY